MLIGMNHTLPVENRPQQAGDVFKQVTLLLIGETVFLQISGTPMEMMSVPLFL